jgi:hypothetical protein
MAVGLQLPKRTEYIAKNGFQFSPHLRDKEVLRCAADFSTCWEQKHVLMSIAGLESVAG